MSKKRRRKQNVRPAFAKASARKLAEKPAERKAAPAMPKLRKLEPVDHEAEFVELIARKEGLINKLAYKQYLAEGGDIIEQMMGNGQRTARAYLSQIRAAEEGGTGWGPNITPYEDRMNRSLQLRLIREKQKWIEQCRKQIIESMQESFEQGRENEEPTSESQLNLQRLGSNEAESPEPEEEVEATSAVVSASDEKPVLSTTAATTNSNADGP